MKEIYYIAYQGFWQAYLGYGGMVLGLEPTFAISPAPSINYFFKSGQKWLLNNNFATLTDVQSKSLMHLKESRKLN